MFERDFMGHQLKYYRLKFLPKYVNTEFISNIKGQTSILTISCWIFWLIQKNMFKILINLEEGFAKIRCSVGVCLSGCF